MAKPWQCGTPYPLFSDSNNSDSNKQVISHLIYISELYELDE